MIKDPDTNGNVTLEVYKHENGGIFAVDSSYLEQNFEDDKYPVIPDLFEDSNDNSNPDEPNVVKLLS